jgi:TatD DNase family protein
MLIDTHAHVNFQAFSADRNEVVKRTLAAGCWLINVGSNFATSTRAVEMAGEHPSGVFAAIGLHPGHLEEGTIDEAEADVRSSEEKFDPKNYRVLAGNKKVVAIGETGLDYYRLSEKYKPIEEIKDKQKKVFSEHLELAKELDLPLILHCRGSKENPTDAYEEMLQILEKSGEVRGVIHCFGGNFRQASRFIELGFYVGFTGIITFPKTEELKNIAKSLPLDKILIETDCPYLAPEPYRGKRNEPLYVEWVARKIAELKNISYEEVAEITSKTAKKLFKIG